MKHRNDSQILRAFICSSLVLAIFCYFFTSISLAEVEIPQNPKWTPVVDEVFLQETVEQISTEDPLLAVAIFNDEVFVGNKDGVLRVKNNSLTPMKGPQSDVHRILATGTDLWALSKGGLWKLNDGQWSLFSEGEYVDLCQHLGSVVVATAKDLFLLKNDQLVQLTGNSDLPFHLQRKHPPILGVQSYSETLYVRFSNQLAFLKDGVFEYDEVSDWNELPSGSTTKDMKSLGSKLAVCTDRGLGLLRGASWHIVNGASGLCYEDTTCVAEGFAGDYWVGTTGGAIRAVDGEFHFFGEGRWLPSNKVNGITTGKQMVCMATDGGLSTIRYEPFTLQKKAAWYKRHINEWGMLRLGLITLAGDHGDGTYTRHLGDNDVSYTCHYLNGLCFEYAVTHDPKVREQAVDVFKTIKWSEEITPLIGYPARSIYAVDEKATKGKTGSAGRLAEWNTTEDGKWEWKGDTSSDEIVAHIYTVSLFHDTVAQGKEKEAAVEHLQRIVEHIIDNGWVLRDLDGKPTVWGQWSPEFIYSRDHTDERGLNSLEALSFAAVGNALFPSPKLKQAKKQLVEWGYTDNILRQKKTFPDYTRFDDRLAFLSFYPLLRYEDDPSIRAAAIRSLQRSWEVKRIEQQTWFNYIYGGLTGNDCGNAEAVKHLRTYPLDCFNYSYQNSHRHDLQNPAGYINYLEGRKPLTPRDVGWQRWNRSFQQLDGAGGKSLEDPSGWLDAYWMGRYYGMITPPQTKDTELLTVEPRGHVEIAPTYSGPKRPHIF